MPVWRARHQTHNTKNRRVPTLHTDGGGEGHFLFAKRKNRENAEKTQAATHTKNTQGNWALCQLAAFQGFVKWQKKCKNSTLPKEM